jgi:hypothetical protein
MNWCSLKSSVDGLHYNHLNGLDFAILIYEGGFNSYLNIAILILAEECVDIAQFLTKLLSRIHCIAYYSLHNNFPLLFFILSNL